MVDPWLHFTSLLPIFSVGMESERAASPRIRFRLVRYASVPEAPVSTSIRPWNTVRPAARNGALVVGPAGRLRGVVALHRADVHVLALAAVVHTIEERFAPRAGKRAVDARLDQPAAERRVDVAQRASRPTCARARGGSTATAAPAPAPRSTAGPRHRQGCRSTPALQRIRSSLRRAVARDALHHGGARALPEDHRDVRRAEDSRAALRRNR